jgi:serine/threonine protein kinase
VTGFSVGEGALVGETYRVEARLGRGGMGEVWRVRHERTGASYALKLLNADFAAVPGLLTRFQREAEITSSLNHPNLIRVFDFNLLPDGRPYLVMELLEGRELAGVIRDDGGRCAVGRVVGLVGQMAMGLAAAHARGIVHRDLKPANVFVTPLPGSTRELVRILDFGISKVSDGRNHLTATSTIMGTPNYMSPEQARGQTDQIDATTDQWALAAMAYEMLAGRMAFFNEEGPLQVLMAVVNDEPPTFRAIGAKVPPAVEAVIRRGLAKKKSDRFPSVAAFATSLKRAARDAGVDLAEGDFDDGGADAPTGGGAVFAAPGAPPTTLQHATGQRFGFTKLLDTSGPRHPVDAPDSPRRARRGAVVAVVAGVIASGALVLVLTGRLALPLPLRAVTPPPTGAGAPAPAVPALPPPAPRAAVAPLVAPPPAAAAPVVDEPAAPAVPKTNAAAASASRKPASEPASHYRPRKRSTHGAPKRILNEDI